MARTGDYISRRYRVYQHYGYGHQEPPQRGRAPRAYEAQTRRAYPSPFQRRSAPCGSCSWDARPPFGASSFPRAGAGDSYSRGNHPRESTYPTRSGCYLHERNAPPRALQRGVASRSHPTTCEECRGDGRRAHLRVHRCPTRRNECRCHERGLEPTPLRVFGKSLQ